MSHDLTFDIIKSTQLFKDNYQDSTRPRDKKNPPEPMDFEDGIDFDTRVPTPFRVRGFS